MSRYRSTTSPFSFFFHFEFLAVAKRETCRIPFDLRKFLLAFAICLMSVFVLIEWQDRHKTRQFSIVASPPKASGISWSYSA